MYKKIAGLVLILLTVSFLLGGCGAKKSNNNDVNLNSEIDFDQYQVIVEPVVAMDDEILLVKPAIWIKVKAPLAEQIQYYIGHGSDEGKGNLVYDDSYPETKERGKSELAWEVPIPDLVYKLTVLIYIDQELIERTLYFKAAEEERIEVETKKEEGKEILDQSNPVIGKGQYTGRVTRLSGLPKYFLASAWLDNNQIIGMSGNIPVIYNIDSKQSQSLPFNAWSIIVAPDGQKLIFRSEKGINIYSFASGKSEHIWPKEPIELGDVGGAMWAPDSDKVLLWYEYEWSGEYFTYDIATKEITPINVNMDGYFLTFPATWKTRDKIIFNTRASVRKDGTSEYSHGFRGDIAGYDIQAKKIELITDSDDGYFIEAVASLDEDILFFRSYQETYQQETNQQQYFGLLNTNGEVVTVMPGEMWLPGGRTKDNWLYVEIIEDNRTLSNGNKLMAMKNSAAEIVAEMLVGDTIQQLLLSPDETKLLLSFSYRVPASIPGSFVEEYGVFLIDLLNL